MGGMLINSFVLGVSVTFATWNPSDKDANLTLSNGNLTVTGGAGLGGGVRGAVRATIDAGDMGIDKFYFELTINAGGQVSIGWALSGTTLVPNASLSNIPTNCVYYQGAPRMWAGESSANFVGGTAPSMSAGETWGVGIDSGANKIRFWRSGSELTDGTGFSIDAGDHFPYIILSNPSEQITANFGATAFAMSVPSGFRAGVYV